MQEYFKILNEYGEEYADYWYDCVIDGTEPSSYEEWLEDEDYRQEQINRLFFTDEEKYGYYED